jgi:TPR repeat protein
MRRGAAECLLYGTGSARMRFTMKRSWNILVVAGALQLSGACAQAQIRYLTVPTPRNPVPPMRLLLPSVAPAASPPAAQKVKVRPPALQGPAFDKSEVDKRVLAFQRKQAREGSASAEYELGIRYLKGNGVGKDAHQARYWLSLAAKGGSLQAHKKLQELDASSQDSK